VRKTQEGGGVELC